MSLSKKMQLGAGEDSLEAHRQREYRAVTVRQLRPSQKGAVYMLAHEMQIQVNLRQTSAKRLSCHDVPHHNEVEPSVQCPRLGHSGVMGGFRQQLRAVCCCSRLCSTAAWAQCQPAQQSPQTLTTALPQMPTCRRVQSLCFRWIHRRQQTRLTSCVRQEFLKKPSQESHILADNEIWFALLCPVIVSVFRNCNDTLLMRFWRRCFYDVE